MDFLTYLEKKLAGIVEIIRAGSGFALKIKRWDSDTGEQVDDVIISLDIENLIKSRDDFQAVVDGLTQLISDIKNFK